MNTKDKSHLLLGKHESAGHFVSVDPGSGVLFCVTCGHSTLSFAQEAALELLQAAKTAMLALEEEDGWTRVKAKLGAAIVSAEGGR